MSTEMSSTLSVQEGLIRIENAERFKSKPEAADHVHVVVMQKSGKSLRHYVTLRNSGDHLSIGEQFWGNYVCYIVDMRSRNTKIAQEFVTRDHITNVHVTVDIAYKAVDGDSVALGVDDALKTLRDELTNYLKREIGRLAFDQVTEEYLDGRIYQEGMRLQSWTGLSVHKVTVTLTWPKEIVDQIKANKEKRRQLAEEDEKRRREAAIEDEKRLRSQRLEREDIDHVDVLMEKLGLASMPADVKLKLMGMPREQAYIEIANFIDETRKQYQARKLERDEREYQMLLKLINDGTLEDMELVDLGKKLLARHMNVRERDEDMDLSSSVLFGKRDSSKRLTGSSDGQKRLARPADDTEED